jgi:transcriptional regulator with XRE-family HTH domain
MTKDEILEFIKANEPHPLHDSAKANTLEGFMAQQANESFSEMLFRLIREKGLREPDIYKRAGLTPQHFSKIRSDRSYKPTKETVLSLAIALRLTLPETKDLLRTAGLAFTHASKRDMVVEYCIINENWDIFSINEALDALGLEPLR